MGKGAAGKQQVNEYYMSIHAGICIGPVDAITALYVGEKLAWTGEVTEEAAIAINAPSLFGGNKDGGGVGGVMYYLPGNRNQVMPNVLAARQGLSSNSSPAYRGVASVYFIGSGGLQSGSVNIIGTIVEGILGLNGTGNSSGGGYQDPGGSDGGTVYTPRRTEGTTDT